MSDETNTTQVLCVSTREAQPT